MNMMSMKRKATTTTGEVKPRITLSSEDYERLALLARAAEGSMPELISVLTGELDRAHVLAQGRPEQTVCMGSEIAFRDDSSGKIETVTLVYPAEADISRRRISVMTPVGTALIGLSVGDSITWETRNGDRGLLTVLEVREPSLA
jgi:regulator of nucleoside diphosphate kinase